MKKIICLIISLVLISSTIYSAELNGNVASIDLTPPIEMQFPLGGYGERMNKPALGVHDRIWAKALVLKDENIKYAIVTLDIVGLPPSFKPQLISKLETDGWSEENVMLLPSHSHSSINMSAINKNNNLNSPQIGIFQPELLEFVIKKLSEVIREADKNYQFVRIGTSNIIVEGMNRNRRRDADVDRELTVTRIDYENGKPMTLLVNWTAHPTFMSEKDIFIASIKDLFTAKMLKYSLLPFVITSLVAYFLFFMLASAGLEQMATMDVESTKITIENGVPILRV